jgi:hypothetical protein
MLNLQSALGHSYQVEFERSALDEKDDKKRAYIECETGAVIRPFGRNRLAVILDDPELIERLAEIDGVARYRGTEDTYVFTLDEWQDVADVLQPKTLD